MYKLLKEKGTSSNVVLENTDTNGTLNLGRLTLEMNNILEKGGYTTSPRDEWVLDLDTDTKNELARLAMRMRKPIRDQRKPKVDNSKIDAMDVILGLAHYSK